MREVCMHQIKVFRQRLYLWSQDVKSLQFRGLHNMSNIGGQQDETIRGELQAKQGKNVEQISQDPKPKKERIDYFQVAEQNKRRIQQIKQYRASKNHNQLATEFPFSSKYLERLVSIKYYYADLVSIVGELIMQITGKSEGEINENFLVQRANIHFLLYVYHLYPKEFKGFKEEFVNILNVYLQAELGNSGALNSNSQEEVQRQRQFFVYLRTFLQSEFSALNNHNRLNLEIVEEYFLLIKVKYNNEKTLLIQGKKNQSTDKNQNELEMIKLLRKYLIRLPNIWVGSKPKQHLQDQGRSSQNNESKDRETLRLSQIGLEVLDFFVEQFSHSFKREIDTWMDPNSTLTAIPKPLPNNFSYKNFYSQYFKSSQYRTRLNILEVGLHRLWQVIDEKQAKVTGNIGGQRDKERNQMGSGAFRRQLQKQWGAEIEYVRGRYNNKTINVVEYLPLSNTKMKEDDFLKLLILLKNIMTYHTLRELQPNQLTSYLKRMFQTNEELILIPLPLTNPAAQKRRQIRLMIGELISKLSSGMWADEEEKLGRWVSISEVSKANKQKEKGRRNNRGEWVEVDT